MTDDEMPDDCLSCAGSGELYERRCPYCKGSGISHKHRKEEEFDTPDSDNSFFDWDGPA